MLCLFSTTFETVNKLVSRLIDPLCYPQEDTIMSRTFDKTKLKALATELAKDIKTEKDLSNLFRALLQLHVHIS